MPERLVIPNGHDDDIVIAHISGGKDSTALALALKEADIPFRAVFADTQWEAPQTYAALDVLEKALGGVKIARVGKPGGFVQLVREQRIFPSQFRRFCTKELKIEPMQKFHEAIRDAEDADTICTVGIRAEESASRAKMPLFEYDDSFGGFVWRPLIKWTIEDVIAIHHRHNVPVNDLYRLGFDRVGCLPCVMANKSDIRALAEHFPDRIRAIRALEKETTERQPNKRLVASMFQAMGRTNNTMLTQIDDIVAWAKADGDGVLANEGGLGGCFRWGFCDAPAKLDSEGDDPSCVSEARDAFRAKSDES